MTDCTRHTHTDEFEFAKDSRIVHATDRAFIRAMRRNDIMYREPTIMNVRLKRQAVSLCSTLLQMAQNT